MDGSSVKLRIWMLSFKCGDLPNILELDCTAGCHSDYLKIT